MEADPKRTGVKATFSEWKEPPYYLESGRWQSPPGTLSLCTDGSFLLACPGCGTVGSGRDGAKWTVAGGSWDDVSTLTLNPSIQKSCCGWHGYLRNGVFESC